MQEALEKKHFDTPNEIRKFPKVDISIVRLGNHTLRRAILEPGWKWSEHIKPIVKSFSCNARHFLYVIAGKVKIVADDGSSQELEAGDVGLVPAKHDAWVVGNERFVAIDFAGARELPL